MMKSPRRAYIDSEYGQLHFRSVGHRSNKPTIVCLHMVPKSSQSFARTILYLAKDRLVIAPDYPGYGESDPPPADPPVRIEDYARVVLKLTQDLDTGPIQLVGYHTGSMVAAEIAFQRPDLVKKLINISAPIFTHEEKLNLSKYFAPIPLDKDGSRFKIMWSRIMEYRGPGMTLEMAARSMAENMRGGENYEWGHRAAFNNTETYASRLTELKQPILVMNLKDDLYTHSLRADKLIQNGYRKDYPEWGHGFLEVFPEQVAIEILDFLDR